MEQQFVGLILEIKTGPFVGKKVPVANGQSLVIGRAPNRAQFAIPHDNHMSGVHLAVECSPNGCRITDKKSTNGTFLNGARVQEAMLAAGDVIKVGQTVFAVRIVPDDQLPGASPIAQSTSSSPSNAPREAAPKEGSVPATPASPPPGVSPPPPVVPDRSSKLREEPPPSIPSQRPDAPQPAPPLPPARKPAQPEVSPAVRSGQPTALAIGSWAFARIPVGWQIQEGLGIQLKAKDDTVFPSNVGAMEEPLGPGITLSQYVEAQTKMFREYLPEPQIDAALPPKIPGAFETIALELRFITKNGSSMFYRCVYARSRSAIGVLTLTALEKDLSSVRPAYDSFLAGASFSSQS